MLITAKRIGQITGVPASTILDNLTEDQDSLDSIWRGQGFHRVSTLIIAMHEVTTILEKWEEEKNETLEDISNMDDNEQLNTFLEMIQTGL